MKGPRRHRLIAFAAVCALALTVHAAQRKKEKKKKRIGGWPRAPFGHLRRTIQTETQF